MVATDGSELVRKAVDSAIETAKLCKAKLYAIYVISLGGYSITPSRDTEWEKAMKEQLITEGKEATTYVENTGKAAKKRDRLSPCPQCHKKGCHPARGDALGLERRGGFHQPRWPTRGL